MRDAPIPGRTLGVLKRRSSRAQAQRSGSGRKDRSRREQVATAPNGPRPRGIARLGGPGARTARCIGRRPGNAYGRRSPSRRRNAGWWAIRHGHGRIPGPPFEVLRKGGGHGPRLKGGCSAPPTERRCCTRFPQAARGGPSAAVSAGDSIAVDSPDWRAYPQLSNDEIARRFAGWTQPEGSTAVDCAPPCVDTGVGSGFAFLRRCRGDAFMERSRGAFDGARCRASIRSRAGRPIPGSSGRETPAPFRWRAEGPAAPLQTSARFGRRRRKRVPSARPRNCVPRSSPSHRRHPGGRRDRDGRPTQPTRAPPGRARRFGGPHPSPIHARPTARELGFPWLPNFMAAPSIPCCVLRAHPTESSS